MNQVYPLSHNQRVAMRVDVMLCGCLRHNCMPQYNIMRGGGENIFSHVFYVTMAFRSSLESNSILLHIRGPLTLFIASRGFDSIVHTKHIHMKSVSLAVTLVYSFYLYPKLVLFGFSPYLCDLGDAGIIMCNNV